MVSHAKVPTHMGKYGDHPVGGAVGAVVGAAAGIAAVAAASGAAVGAVNGATLGAVIGLPGMAAGVVFGGVVGALAGKGVAQEINPTTEDAYWSEAYSGRSYVQEGDSYDTYSPAYRHGIEAYHRYDNRPFDDIEPQLKNKWDVSGQDLSWDKAKPAARDAYDRLRNKTSDI